MLDLPGAHRDLIMTLNNNIYGILDTKFVKVTTSQAMVRSQRTYSIRRRRVSLQLVVELERNGVDAMALVGWIGDQIEQSQRCNTTHWES